MSWCSNSSEDASQTWVEIFVELFILSVYQQYKISKLILLKTYIIVPFSVVLNVVTFKIKWKKF